MSDPKILIVGSSYVADDSRRELTKLWFRLVKHLNPNVDLCLVDSASPFDPREFLPFSHVNTHRFEDNIGAISQGGRDGSGRAFCKSLELAVTGGYDYVVPWETDFLFALPVTPIINKIHRHGVKVAAMFANPYQFPEWGISFWSTRYIVESRYIERYDWEHAPSWPVAEWRNAALLDDALFILPIHGFRNHENTMNIVNIAHMFPYHPCRFLTQCRDFQLYYRFLDLNNISLTT